MKTIEELDREDEASNDPKAKRFQERLREIENIDTMIANQERKLYSSKLDELKLCERIGINGEIMLYPSKEKEKKWYNREYEAMVEQLYQVKHVEEFNNVGQFDDSCTMMLDTSSKT